MSYYLFSYSGDAVWKLASDQTSRYLHYKFDRLDYVLWEKDILRLGKLWHGCTKIKTNRRDCQEEIFEKLHKYLKDFQWFGDIDHNRRFYAAIRVAYQAMEILMFKVLAEKPLVETRKDIADWYVTIEEEFLEAMKYFADFQTKMGCERTFDLSPVTVCQLKQVFWQEFEQPACETRWKKSLDNKNDKLKAVKRDKVEVLDDEGSTVESGDNSGDGSASGDEDTEQQSNNKENEKEEEEEEEEQEEEEESNDNDKFYETFKPDFSKIEKIGGITNDFRTIMDAKFSDFRGEKTIHLARKIADLHKRQKGEVIEELINLAYDKRQVYEDKVSGEIKRVTAKTYGKLERAAKNFHRQLKQFLKNSRLQTV